jgi:hypothetical protein
LKRYQQKIGNPMKGIIAMKQNMNETIFQTLELEILMIWSMIASPFG